MVRGAGGNAEVGQLHLSGTIEQHIRRLQVTVNDSLFMRVLQRTGEIDEHRHDFQVRGAAQLAQVTASGQLHRQHGQLTIAHAVDRS